MLRSTNFWFGVAAGIAIPWLYSRYAMRKNSGQ